MNQSARAGAPTILNSYPLGEQPRKDRRTKRGDYVSHHSSHFREPVIIQKRRVNEEWAIIPAKMPVDQFFPLERNRLTQEPFLRLRKHRNIVMTPMRWDDAPHIAALLNDPRVYKWLMYTPYPYTLKDGEEWIQLTKPKIDAILQELQDAQGQDELKIVGGAPVCSIREIQENGTDVYIGSLDIIRCLENALLGVDAKQAQQKANHSKILKNGDADIIWSFGDYLAPSHHRQGIMTDAIDTLLHEWAIPRMNVHRIISSAFLGNRGSVRVFEKNGFVMTRTIQEHAVVRGEMRGSHVLEWTIEDSENGEKS